MRRRFREIHAFPSVFRSREGAWFGFGGRGGRFSGEPMPKLLAYLRRSVTEAEGSGGLLS